MSQSSEWTPISVRKAWPLEAHFTTWLAENINLLSKKVKIDLELLQEEAPLPGWGGRVDVLAKVAGTDPDEYVVIENQMEDSDNDHLAGLLNYASQSGSKILIWVAGEFTDWHRRTVDWLNENDGVQIYAVKMKAWRNGDNIERGLELVASPSRRKKWAGYTYPAAKRTFLDFFQPIVEELLLKGIADTNVAKANNNQTFPSGFPGIGYNVGFWHSIGRSPSLDVYLWIGTPDRGRNKEIFGALYQYRDAIECELPGVGWDRKDNQSACSIYFIKRGSITYPDEQLAELQAWATGTLCELKRVIQPHLENVMRELTSEEIP